MVVVVVVNPANMQSSKFAAAIGISAAKAVVQLIKMPSQNARG